MQRKADGGLGEQLPGVPGKKPSLPMPVKAFSIQRFKLPREEGLVFVAHWELSRVLTALLEMLCTKCTLKP